MTTRRTRRARLEMLLGFVTFFAGAALIAAIANVLRPDPQIVPALVAAALLGLDWWIYRAWRRS